MFEGRLSIFDGRHINHRSSTHRSLVFEGQHIHLRRSTHRSSKVDTSISEGRHIETSIFEGRHIDIRKLTHRYRSSKVDASIFEDRRRKHHTYNSSSNIAHNCARKSLEWTKLHTSLAGHTHFQGEWVWSNSHQRLVSNTPRNSWRVN